MDKKIGIIGSGFIGGMHSPKVYEDEVIMIHNQYDNKESGFTEKPERRRKRDIEKQFPIKEVPNGFKNQPKPLSKKQKAKIKKCIQ